jgi:hypothetical protein
MLLAGHTHERTRAPFSRWRWVWTSAVVMTLRANLPFPATLLWHHAMNMLPHVDLHLGWQRGLFPAWTQLSIACALLRLLLW